MHVEAFESSNPVDAGRMNEPAVIRELRSRIARSRQIRPHGSRHSAYRPPCSPTASTSGTSEKLDRIAATASCGVPPSNTEIPGGISRRRSATAAAYRCSPRPPGGRRFQGVTSMIVARLDSRPQDSGSFEPQPQARGAARPSPPSGRPPPPRPSPGTSPRSAGTARRRPTARSRPIARGSGTATPPRRWRRSGRRAAVGAWT